MIHKYINVKGLGFVSWPKTYKVTHQNVGTLFRRQDDVISAGFVEFDNGEPHCYGCSESLNINSREEDSDLFAQQLNIRK